MTFDLIVTVPSGIIEQTPNIAMAFLAVVLAIGKTEKQVTVSGKIDKKNFYYMACSLCLLELPRIR